MGAREIVRGESYQNAMATLLAAVLIAVVPLLMTQAAWWPLYVPTLAAVAVAGYVLLPEADIPAPGTLPPELLRSLADRLRAAGYRAVLSPAWVTVRIDGLSAVRLRTRVTDRGTVLSYQARPTPVGGLLVAVLIAAMATAIPAVGVLVYLRARAGRFARDRIAASLPKATPTPPPKDEIHGLLVGGLSNGERLARQAFEAQRSAYWDLLLDVGLAGVLAWIAVLIGLFVALNGFNLLTGDWTIPLTGSSALAGILAGVLAWVVRAKYRPEISRYAEWADRLGLALAREQSLETPGPTEPSSFELLASTSEQVPIWIEAQRRAGISADPAAAFVLLFLCAMAFSLGSNVVAAFAQGALVLGLFWALASLAVAIGAASYATHWNRLRHEELARLRSEWDARTRGLRERMDRFLQEM